MVKGLLLASNTTPFWKTIPDIVNEWPSQLSHWTHAHWPEMTLQGVCVSVHHLYLLVVSEFIRGTKINYLNTFYSKPIGVVEHERSLRGT
jgi:hypothetical protein